jgi:hypothetical protein
MHGRRLFWQIALLAGALLLLPATPALAQGGQPGDGGTVIWNEDYTLEADQQLGGDLVVFNGDVTLEAGSVVEGSVVVWNGSAEVEGTIEKDIVVSSGDIHLGPSAWVQGDAVCSWHCELEREDGARLDGETIEGLPMGDFRWPGFTWTPPSAPFSFWSSGPGWLLNKTFEVIRALLAVLVVAVIAGLVALIWPQPMARVGQAVVQAPLASFGAGLLAMLTAVVLVVALAITICLPVILLLAVLAAGLFGWACIGALIGERLLQALKVQEIAPLWAAAAGTLLISLLSAGLSVALCLAPLGWLLTFVVGSLGLGAVVLTRFGTQTYIPRAASSPPPVP